jgi:ATP-dependent helicase/nuclease subunit B
MGLSENEWPPAVNNNPFLPRKIQLKYKVPAASTELQYQLANDLLRHFATATSDTLILSHPLQAEDISLKPSMLLQQFSGAIQQQSFEALSEGLHPYSQKLFTLAREIIQLETLTDSLNIPLKENEITTGGTALIADQAACPFRSFAKHRLKAIELPKLSYGLPAYAVGNMLHYAMEVFWQGLKDQRSIDQLSPAQQEALILNSASSAVKHISRRYPETMNARYSQMEIQRLSELLTLWLDEERKRGFFTVIEHEYTLQWRYAKLTLEFRIDRIEQFEDNSFGLVDYKTSKNNNNVNWFEERQEKPQLLLYLQAAEKDPKFQKVSSLLYAQVNIEDMRFRGIAENSDSYPGVALDRQRNRPESMSWEELRTYWQQSLESLAQEFLDGYLPVEPKSVASCQYCHLQALCRIQEKRQQE